MVLLLHQKAGPAQHQLKLIANGDLTGGYLICNTVITQNAGWNAGILRKARLKKPCAKEK